MEKLRDPSAEIAVLSSIAQHGKNAYLDVSDIITSTSFSLHTNQQMFALLSHVLTNNIDAKIDYHVILSTARELGIEKDINEDKRYIQRILEFKSELSNTRMFAQKLRKFEETKKLVGRLNDTALILCNDITGNELMSAIVAKAEEPIFGFINQLTLDGKNQIELIGVGLDEYIAEKEGNPVEVIGIPTCFPIWQEMMGGLAEGVHVVTARPKVGKSTFAVNVALWVSWKENIPVLYLDTELNKRSGTWDRMLAKIAKVPFYDIRTGQYSTNEVMRRNVHKAKKVLNRIPLSYINITGKNFDEVISLVRRWIVQTVGYDSNGNVNKCLLVYDYLKLTGSAEKQDMKEYEAIGYRMSSLHDLTVAYSLPCLTFCQLNREFDVSQSDRIRWFCTSMCSLQKKTEDELAQDGRENGNRKLIPEDFRFGPGLEDGDYINMQLDGRIAEIREMKTRNQLGLDNANQNRLEPDEADQDF